MTEDKNTLAFDAFKETIKRYFREVTEPTDQHLQSAFIFFMVASGTWFSEPNNEDMKWAIEHTKKLRQPPPVEPELPSVGNCFDPEFMDALERGDHLDVSKVPLD